MRVAFVGCGFVADYYASTLPNYPELELVGVMDREAGRATKFAQHWKLPVVYPTLQALLDDRSVELVLNLTNPRSHFEVSKACLLAGRHVYSEKPLATIFGEAEELVRLAEEKGLHLSSAPCNVLGESAQTAWKALREGAIGKVRLVYAELDDGLIHRMRYTEWINPSGAPWPYKDEFEVGCTLSTPATTSPGSPHSSARRGRSARSRPAKSETRGRSWTCWPRISRSGASSSRPA